VYVQRVWAVQVEVHYTKVKYVTTQSYNVEAYIGMISAVALYVDPYAWSRRAGKTTIDTSDLTLSHNHKRTEWTTCFLLLMYTHTPV